MLRRFVLACPISFLAFVVAGCGVSQKDVETHLRTEIKKSLGVEISSFDLKKEPGDSYVGTGATQKGDVYDLTAKVADGKLTWQAIPGQAMLENDIRQGVEKQFSKKIKSLQLDKSAPGSYVGKVELATGEKLDVKIHQEAGQVKWEAKPVGP